MISVSESEIADCRKMVNDCLEITKTIINDSIAMIESTKQETNLCSDYIRAQTEQPHPGGYTIDDYNNNQNASNTFLSSQQRKNEELTQHIQTLCAFIERIPDDSRTQEIQNILNLYGNL